MSGWSKVLIVMGFSVTVTLAAMFAMTMLMHHAIPFPFWIFAAVCPALISGPVSFVLVRQSAANDRLNRQLLATQAVLREQADLDHLTGTLNRAAFYRQAGAIAGEAGACVLLADIDHFKAINDRHGHAAGDHALRIVAATLKAALRPGDLLGRVGGEEFAILLVSMPVDLGMEIAARACGAVSSLRVKAPDGTPIALSISIGVACLAETMSLDDALACADNAMYSAKRGGRNRAQAAG